MIQSVDLTISIVPDPLHNIVSSVADRAIGEVNNVGRTDIGSRCAKCSIGSIDFDELWFDDGISAAISVSSNQTDVIDTWIVVNGRDWRSVATDAVAKIPVDEVV